MQKKYTISLSIIMLLLVATLFVGTGYGVWLSDKNPTETNTRNIECFKVYYDNDGIIEMSKIKPVLSSDGETTSPYTITLTNTCANEKEVQIRLNTVESTTIDVNALTLKTSGNIEKDSTLYKNLETTKTSEEGIKVSKLIGKIKVSPNETIRTNIRMWFDERKVPSVTEKNNYFKGHIEIIDSDSAIKPTLIETLLSEKEAIEKKKAPEFENAEFNEEGMFAMKAPGGTYYYYRGVVNNNYVKFGDQIWRIVGINPNKTIKLVLNNSAANVQYASSHKYMDYTGFTYDYNKVQVDNGIRTQLKNWYTNNLANKEADKYIVEYSFCNDTSMKASGNRTYFGAYTRIFEDASPSMTCPSKKVDFGGVYKQKVGLLTADEVALAGAAYETNNYNYYLFNGTAFFTMSPSSNIGNTANVMIVTNTGSIAEAKTDSTYALRPVINIQGDLTYTGSGTQNNPYVINLEQ